MSMKQSTSRTIAGLLFLAAALTVINVAYLYFYLDYRYPTEKEEIVDRLRDNTTLVSPFITADRLREIHSTKHNDEEIANYIVERHKLEKAKQVNTIVILEGTALLALVFVASGLAFHAMGKRPR